MSNGTSSISRPNKKEKKKTRKSPTKKRIAPHKEGSGR